MTALSIRIRFDNMTSLWLNATTCGIFIIFARAFFSWIMDKYNDKYKMMDKHKIMDKHNVVY